VSIAAKNVHNHKPKCVRASPFFGGKRLRADSEKRNAGVLLCFLHLRPTADLKLGLGKKGIPYSPFGQEVSKII
jgi:hypothetical protein